jgi:hypothetical protein
MLECLRGLSTRIREARTALAPLETGLAAARREFDERVGSLRREALRIEHQIEALRAPVQAVASAEFASTMGTGDFHDHLSGVADTSPGDPEAIEKDILLEHLFCVLDTDLDKRASDLLATVQGLCYDPDTTLADLLEELPWGPAWTARKRSEDLAAQHRRLAVWKRALHRQLEALEHDHERLSERDPRYRLYQERQRGLEAWEAYLDRAAARQREQNQELRAELDELRRARPDTGDDP